MRSANRRDSCSNGAEQTETPGRIESAADRHEQGEGADTDSAEPICTASGDGDTPRVATSAMSFARRCLRSEEYVEATTALHKVLEIAHPGSAAYCQAALHVAQLLQAANQLQEAIGCILSLWQTMPPPFSCADGIFIIARLYEQLGEQNAACFWWKKLSRSSVRPNSAAPSRPQDPMQWEAVADLAFQEQLFVFAADWYAQALALKEDQPPPQPPLASCRFAHRYLLALHEFVGVQGPAAHQSRCNLVAWKLAQRFRRHDPACFADDAFYRLRALYGDAFPAIFRVIFAWVDGPAGRIARCWRRHWQRTHPCPKEEATPSAPKTVNRGKGRATLTTRGRGAACAARGRAPRACNLSPSPKKSDPTVFRKSRPLDKPSPSSASPEARAQDSGRVPRKSRRVHRSNNGETLEVAARETPCETQRSAPKPHVATHKPDDRVTRSPARRTLGSVRNLRTKKLEDDVLDQNSSSGAKLTAPEPPELASNASLLDVYPLELPGTDDFVASCGREPGFADLELAQLAQFARLAHYRARVLAGKHLRVESLEPERVKPRWLQDLERAAALVQSQQQRALASGKVLVESDSAALLAEVHTRVVLQLAALRRQYTRAFGPTTFTRRLRTTTRRLAEWKFSRISDLLGALEVAKTSGLQEETQRNLEFFHVHGPPSAELRASDTRGQ